MIFTCKDCGSHELKVVHEYSQTTYLTATLACDCGTNDIAAQKISHDTVVYEEWGLLDDKHHWKYDECEVIDHTGKEVDEHEIFCVTCTREAELDGLDWEVEVETEVDEDSHEFYVYCAGCGREIEFGWSHPGQGGRIWPAETDDFNPWKSWPEPRYRERWAEKGWIRPDRR